jgi:predicted ATPase
MCDEHYVITVDEWFIKKQGHAMLCRRLINALLQHV